MSQLEAVIFDVDGTLIDTEQIQSDAFLHVLSEHGHHQTELTEHGTVHIPGEATSETWSRLKERHELPPAIYVLTERKRKAALTALQTELTALPGVVHIIDELHENGVKMAVASSAQKERLEYILKGLKLWSYFAAVVSANDVKNVKPAPDAYIVAAEKLQVAPENCIVIEDTMSGITSAKAAGMKAVAVPNRYTALMDFNEADLVVDSLEDLNYEKLVSIIKG
jgi:HAD superfamily hydrolase (TIGR01509 family)